MIKAEYLPLEKLLDASNGSVYKLTVLVAKRGMQLADGAKPLVENPEDKFLDSALKEIAEKKIRASSKKK